ncbi:MAG: hypothetical protein R3B13_26575 [Polyangiaceae bacterium]
MAIPALGPVDVSPTTRPAAPIVGQFSLPKATRGTVPATRTQLTGDQAAQALERALSRASGKRPPREMVAVLSAQWAHETGRGASMYNYNFGGIKGTGPSGLSVRQRTREGWGQGEQTIRDSFRAYQNADEGASDFVSLLARRYPAALEAAERGDTHGFVRALKAKGYFTGNEHAYIRSVDSLTTLALTDGFAALGKDGPAAPSSLAHLEARGVSSASDGGADVSQALGAAQFVDALAIADEIGRAALRMLADEARGDRRDGEPVGVERT